MCASSRVPTYVLREVPVVAEVRTDDLHRHRNQMNRRQNHSVRRMKLVVLNSYYLYYYAGYAAKGKASALFFRLILIIHNNHNNNSMLLPMNACLTLGHLKFYFCGSPDSVLKHIRFRTIFSIKTYLYNKADNLTDYEERR